MAEKPRDKHAERNSEHGKDMIGRDNDPLPVTDYTPKKLPGTRLEKAHKMSLVRRPTLKDTVDDEHSLVLCDGRFLSSVTALAKILEDMPDWVYNHHVNSGRNDFANWISDVYLHPELGDKIDSSKNRQDMLIQLLKYLLVECHGM